MRRHVFWGRFVTPPYSILIDVGLLFLIFFRYIGRIPVDFFQGDVGRGMIAASYIIMGGLGFVLFNLLLIDIWYLIQKLRKKEVHSSERRQLFKGAAVGVGTLAGTSLGYAQSFDPRIKKDVISHKALPDSLDGLNIIQLSDVHIGPLLDHQFVELLVERTNKENPDLIFLTGDMIDGRVNDMTRMMEGFRHLKAKHGVFFVPGNHEYYWGGQEWVDYWRSLGFTSLVNEGQSLSINGSRLGIAGITDPHANRFIESHAPNMKDTCASIKDDDFRILLAHRPKVADEACKHDIHLQFSGHTHGGQTYPFIFIVALVQKYLAGLYDVGDMKLFVSRGAGFWGPPLRVGVPSEINKITLKKS